MTFPIMFASFFPHTVFIIPFIPDLMLSLLNPNSAFHNLKLFLTTISDLLNLERHFRSKA